MKESDRRKINRKALEAIRIRAFKLVEAGESPEVRRRSEGSACQDRSIHPGERFFRGCAQQGGIVERR